MAGTKDCSSLQPSGCRRPTDQGKGKDRPRIVRFKCGFLGIMHYVMCQRPNWVEVKGDGEWDFYWCNVAVVRDILDHTHMKDHVRINHFRNHYELTRKNLLVKNLKRYQKTLEKDMGCTEASKCDFFPSTFTLPNEYHLLVEEFKRNPGSTWIMKPPAKSQGRGIFLFRKLKHIKEWKKDRSNAEEQKDAAQVDAYIAQRYIEKPYLLMGKKFDLRVYVLVSSYVPLKFWMYRDGFARLASTRYSLSNIDDKYIHLTNVSVQKTAPDYDPEKGYKWLMQKLRTYLTAKHGWKIVEKLFKDIDNIIVRSLQSVHSVIINDKHCFELYGYDILLDQDLKPWLIEVNASPSLTASNRKDYQMKCKMLEDILHVLDMEGRLTGKEKTVGGYDLMWNDGPVYKDVIHPLLNGCPTLNTNLGCFNDREKQLCQLFKPFPVQNKI